MKIWLKAIYLGAAIICITIPNILQSYTVSGGCDGAILCGFDSGIYKLVFLMLFIYGLSYILFGLDILRINKYANIALCLGLAMVIIILLIASKLMPPYGYDEVALAALLYSSPINFMAFLIALITGFKDKYFQK